MMTHPNILLLFTDQQRYDTIGALGNDLIKTPVLDQLCGEGTAFTRCYTPSPVCVPARMAMATGLAPHRTGMVNNRVDGGEPPTSFMQRLTEGGYQSHGVGKMHFVPDPLALWGFESRDVSEEGLTQEQGDAYARFINDNGFGHVYEPHGLRSEHYYLPQPSQLPARLHHTQWVADRSIDFLNRRDRTRPFFLWTSFIKPHPPFESPTPWDRLYRAGQMPAPFQPDGYESLLTYWNRVQNRYKYRDAGHDLRLLQTLRAAYYSCISYIDYHIGRILESLGNQLDNTLVLFSSDHGELLGDYGSVGKRCMLDAAARVPMIARWPGRFAPGHRCDIPASLLDVFPTFCSAAEISEEASGENKDSQCSASGVNLMDLARGETSRKTVFSQFQGSGYGLYMATDQTGKYIYSQADQQEWFFDLEADPHETRSCPQNPHSHQLRRRLINHLKDDDYLEPLNGEEWRSCPIRSLPDDSDVGLLLQDHPQLQNHIDALGVYARQVSAQNIDPHNACLLDPHHD